MALGDFNLFTWKSKATLQKEQEEYAVWAFPYGQKQRDILEKLLKEIYPRENASVTLVAYLTCKELYEAALENKPDPGDGNSYYIAVDKVIKDRKRYRQIIKRKDMPMYIALVIVDTSIDERCMYPSADEIRAFAQELTDLFVW
jgi:hypothetical protein